jgi:hypothetical protein
MHRECLLIGGAVALSLPARQQRKKRTEGGFLLRS